LDDAEIAVLLQTGPEVLAGSTRLAAGTSQKAALSLFSTTLMIGLNKVYQGYMVDMLAINDKLVQRAEHMITSITQCSLDAARQALKDGDNNIKLAVLLAKGANRPDAEKLLEQHDGNLGAAIGEVPGG
jgi:N-acetylmuramic acid 6-phosphate etherase